MEMNQQSTAGNHPSEVSHVVHYIPAALIVMGVGIALVALLQAIPHSAPQAQTASAVEANPFASLSIGGKAAIVIDIPTGKILYQKNSDAQLPLASLAKVMLALVVSEALPAEMIITIPYYAGGSGSGHLLKGELWSVADVIDFTLVTSSNNGAEILAAAANDRVHERFPQSPADPPGLGATLWRMNDLARMLGLQQTYFLNASGLDFSTNQSGAYGSAADMAALFAYAASADPSLFAGTAKDGILLSGSGRTTIASNTNDAQGTIPGLIMGKTGLTDLAGGNLAVVFDVGLAHPVVAVVLGSTEKGRFDDMQKLVAAARIALTRAARE